MEYIVAGAVTAGIVALDEGIKHLCRFYLNKHGEKANEETM